jgi:hypothetical protein
MLNPIAQKISSHPQLASKVNALLPAGTTLNCVGGLQNQGQLQVLHVEEPRDPFSQLRRT